MAAVPSQPDCSGVSRSDHSASSKKSALWWAVGLRSDWHSRLGFGKREHFYFSLRAVRSAAVLFFVLHRFILAASSAYFFSLLFPSSQPPIDRVSPNAAQSSSRSRFWTGRVVWATNTWAVGLARRCRRRFDPHSQKKNCAYAHTLQLLLWELLFFLPSFFRHKRRFVFVGLIAQPLCTSRECRNNLMRRSKKVEEERLLG